MFVFRAAVVGAGTMGGEIAQAIAAADVPVVLKDVEQRFVDLGLQKAEQVTRGQLAGQVQKGRLTEEQAEARATEILSHITPTTSYDAFGDVDVVIEAVPERMEVKQAVFAELDEVTPGHALLASNTSALSITEIAEVTLRPEQVLGFHFFWPASVMRLVEIVEGDATSAEAVTAAIAFAQRIRKTPITCAEVPGFVVNRILNSAMSEVWRAQEEEELDTRAVDAAVKDAKVAPMGPYLLTDLLGLDTVLHVAQHLEAAYGERFYVHRGMRELVAAGHLGQKTGKGFYEHGD
jgi:3-hydroxyacyl-CoA dehydrogenase